MVWTERHEAALDGRGSTEAVRLIILYFNPWFLFIQAVNAGLIAGILWLDWPTKSMVGA